jgi:hypothetical protein
MPRSRRTRRECAVERRSPSESGGGSAAAHNRLTCIKDVLAASGYSSQNRGPGSEFPKEDQIVDRAAPECDEISMNLSAIRDALPMAGT